jgi:hypothetical protein
VSREPTGRAVEAAAESDPPDREELVARIDVLAEENRRLRAEYARARQSQYRRTALGLFVLGAAAVAAAAALPDARTVLLALGGIGLFGAVLTYYLTPERVVPASVGERVYAAHADAGDAVVADLGLSEERVYLPDGPDDRRATLFVPQHAEFSLPDPAALDGAFVVDADERARGLVLRPTGEPLFAELERVLTGDLAGEPATAAEQVADGLVDQFELVDAVRVDAPAGDEAAMAWRVSAGVSGSTYGAVDRFDHPVASLLATGLAIAVDDPVSVTVEPGDDRSDHVVTVQPVSQWGWGEGR